MTKKQKTFTRKELLHDSIYFIRESILSFVEYSIAGNHAAAYSIFDSACVKAWFLYELGFLSYDKASCLREIIKSAWLECIK